ncbi:endonuclease/exonuclease/phosphatase family protein [Streptomyces millisiae]|uniref:Endonuclease/exonuclease/phosphatase family protein n=1 Tax=Streptomyces millisiae TaxID=3075542 RepID=A0ABU2LW86_9ACTN|nr:endonuclease/exonuclease/phosphatase family protein [Streptomyces sp. DSM 44918]MDT0321862.1 endonuclease/exonuclease/phosphatase family protein [Streptomyces sp. DSM 44918]
MRIANLNAYKLSPTARGSAGWQARITAIREINPDILAVQEVVVDERALPRERWNSAAAEVIHDLAEQCGLTATARASSGRPHVAMAANGHRPWYTALMWRPSTVSLLPDSFAPYGAPDFWHGLTTASFDVGGPEPLIVASYHGDPFRPNFRADEALRIKGIFRRTGGVKPGFLVGDFNAPSAAVIDGEYYDDEWYRDQHHDDLEFQVQAGTIGGAQLADRRQAQALLRGGNMVDAAAHLEAAWRPTVGHWADGRGDPDPWGPRRIDLILATRPVAPALVSYATHRSAAALDASDHLPVIADFDPTAMRSTR